MRNTNLEQCSVEQVMQEFPEVVETLRAHGIDRNSRLRLRDAAAAASVSTDELLAVAEARVRRAARRNVRVVEEEADVGELVLV